KSKLEFCSSTELEQAWGVTKPLIKETYQGERLVDFVRKKQYCPNISNLDTSRKNFKFLSEYEVLIDEIKIGDFVIITYFEKYYPAQITDKNSEKVLANAMVKAGGEGYFGTVYKALPKYENKNYAVKKLKYDKVSDAEKLKEIRNFEKVGYYLHIIKYIMGWEEEAEIMSLASYVKATKDVPEFVFWDFIHDVCLASIYLAEKRLVHYDVKDDNILIHGKHFKLADFGTVVGIRE
uniref:Membrane-associated tyrosine- and threonine-specific cdc2-inhibitory kinase-like n=1 Tax=Diabrotica virgifera virgifera TaxID=50390 RepID=A0A6P7GT14_DIAVI